MKKETHPFEITLRFKTSDERADFVAWYLDGGGEQGSELYTEWGVKEGEDYDKHHILRLTKYVENEESEP